MKLNTEKLFNLFLVAAIFEGLIVAVFLFAIPGDPKNAFLFGYSKNRLLMLTAVILVLAGLLFILIRKQLRTRLNHWVTDNRNLECVMPWVGSIAALLLWLTLFLPPYRFDGLAASFTRLQPLLIWGELLIVQFALLVWVPKGVERFRLAISGLTKSRRFMLVGVVLFVAVALIFLILALVSRKFPGNQLYFPPGAPLSTLAVVLAGVVLTLLLIPPKKRSLPKKWARIIPAFIFVGIWAIALFAWLSIPIACTDDRPGPYPPNNICYPHVNDAVYSIGSHYITLGEGVNNHWLTDKPLYMAFLAFSQFVAGPGIEDYLTFQVAVVALIPALLFLAGRKLIGSAFGLFLAVLATLQEAYSIMLYRAVGSVNVKLENPEVLTALVLILFGFITFNWLKHPDKEKWAVLSGGLLGVAVLFRFNPIAIAPVLLLVLLLVYRRRVRTLIKPILLFIFAFLLVFSPWFFAATDEEGKNHYIAKITDVLASRFGQERDAETGQEKSPSSGSDPLEETDLLAYDSGTIDKAGVEGIAFHFLNNVYTGFAKLPGSFTLHALEEQVSTGMWDFGSSVPLWRKQLNVESLLTLALNLALVLTGVLAAYRKFGLAGLTGVIIQLGYYAGNAVSQTSGGRYLEPVHWVTLFYYSLGILMVIIFFIRAFSSRDLQMDTESNDQSSLAAKPAPERKLVLILLGCCLLIGLVLPALELIPSKLPPEDDTATVNQAYSILSSQGAVSDSEWSEFLDDHRHVLVKGVAYHPRYYRGDFYRPGNLSFELMMLARDFVYIGYSSTIEPAARFSDGSEVIMIGCRLKQDSLWAAKRKIVRMFAILQLDNEGQILLDDEFDWSCVR